MSTPVAPAFHIAGSRHARPSAERVIYADGSGATATEQGALDLSHWVPNRTPVAYKADTSTEICLRYVSDPDRFDADLVVNDHLDIDGILALYSLLFPELARAHRATLIGAAAMGDFLAWADRPAFGLAQELSLFLFDPGRPADVGDAYAAAFSLVTAVLEGARAEDPRTTAGWSIIEQGLAALEAGDVSVSVVSDDVVLYTYPSLPEDLAHAALAIPGLNATVDESTWLWPEVRNRDHGQELQLLAVPAAGAGGWHYDLWAPGYCWAETPARRPLIGLVSTGDSNTWKLDHPPLAAAVAELADREPGDGTWTLATELTPFTTLAGRRFPVIVSCVDPAGDPAPSRQTPADVAEVLAGAW